MTRKDYERAAAILRFEGGCDHAAKVATFVEFFQENPHFDAARFRAACAPRVVAPVAAVRTRKAA